MLGWEACLSMSWKLSEWKFVTVNGIKRWQGDSLEEHTSYVMNRTDFLFHSFSNWHVLLSEVFCLYIHTYVLFIRISTLVIVCANLYIPLYSDLRQHNSQSRNGTKPSQQFPNVLWRCNAAVQVTSQIARGTFFHSCVPAPFFFPSASFHLFVVHMCNVCFDGWNVVDGLRCKLVPSVACRLLVANCTYMYSLTSVDRKWNGMYKHCIAAFHFWNAPCLVLESIAS